MSKYLYGIHDSGGEHLFGDKPGWVVHTVDVRSDERLYYTNEQARRVTPIVRLNWSHHGDGTIPPDPADWSRFAWLCANYVRGCMNVNWITIGNEPNLRVEWGKDDPITPEQYAACYRQVYDAVKAAAPDALIAPAAIGPWNVDSGIDWIDYFRRMLDAIGPERVDWINLHTYSRGYEPRSVTDNTRMDAPYSAYFNGFRSYLDFLNAVPAELRHLPVHITEANGNGPWPDSNTGWVQAAYAEIDRNNRLASTQKIYSLCLFRWPKFDEAWQFETKPGVHEDFRQAVEKGYKVPDVTPAGEGEGAHRMYLPHVTGGDAGQQPSHILPKRDLSEEFKRRVPNLTPYADVPGRRVYRLVKAEYVPDGARRFGPDHHILVDVVDGAGKRLMGVPVNFYWGSGMELTRINKAGEPYGADFGMTAAGHSFGVWIGNFRETSDDVFGMGLGKIGGEHMGEHVTYFLVFQEVMLPSGSTPEKPDNSQPQPEPQPEQPAAGIIDPLTALAFLQVESGNRAFTDGLLTIRFEVHRFKDFLKNDALFDRHFKFTPRQYNDQHWRRSPDAPWQHAHGSMAQRHELLRFARGLNDTAALNATGMGMGQIMGHNAQRVGYPSPQAMFQAFSHTRYGVNAQIMGFVNYVLSDPALAAALRRRDWFTAVQLYNGVGQEQQYIGLLENALRDIGQVVA